MGITRSKDAPWAALACAGIALLGAPRSAAALDVGEAVALPLGASGFPVAEAGVACSPEFCLVVWADEGIHAARFWLSSDAFVGGDVVISTAPGAVSPSVEYANDVFLVAWSQGGDIHASRRDASTAAPLGPTSFVVSSASGAQSAPAVSSFGPWFFVVWVDRRNAAAGDVRDEIYGARLTVAAGELLDPSGVPIATGAGTRTSPAVARSEGNYMVVWGSPAGVAFRRVGSDGAVLGGVTTTALAGERPAIAYDGVSVYAIAAEGGASPRVQLFDAAGAAVAGPLALGTGPVATGGTVALADDFRDFVATWVEAESDGAALRTTRVSRTGQVAAPAPVVEPGLGGGVPVHAARLETGEVIVHYARIPRGNTEPVDSVVRSLYEPEPAPDPGTGGGGGSTGGGNCGISIPLGCSVGRSASTSDWGVFGPLLVLGAVLARRARARRAKRRP